MKKRFLVLTITMIYEAVRIGFILVSRTEGPIGFLPLSWYAGAPLLCVPLILVYFMYKDELKNSIIKKIYIIQKLASITGLIVYAIKTFSYAQFSLTLNDPYSLKLIGFIVLFLGIDSILCIVILVMNKKNSTKSEGAVCK